MLDNLATTPFGSRSVSLGLLALQKASHHIEAGKSVDKWQLYRDLCEARTRFSVSDRTLAVLSALLSFFPDNTLAEGENLIVFPSNKQLSLRAHGMAGPTLRRHLSALVQSGLIFRRDSPNGKRYAYKSTAGEIEEAFGFSLTPLLLRADEITNAAEEIRQHNANLRRTRERITLQRRDIAKLIEIALEQNMAGPWEAIHSEFRAIVDALPRKASLETLQQIYAKMHALRKKLDNTLIINENSKYLSTTDTQIEQHHTNSNTESIIEIEQTIEQIKNENPSNNHKPVQNYPLSLILKACPDIEDYAVNKISNWRDLIIICDQIRGFLGISPSAYKKALSCFGQETTAIIISCILQRNNYIRSAGGYLHALIEKARTNGFSVGPMLMAALNKNM